MSVRINYEYLLQPETKEELKSMIIWDFFFFFIEVLVNINCTLLIKD